MIIKTMCRAGFGGLIYCIGVWGSGLRGWCDRFRVERTHFGLGGVILGLGVVGLGV